MKCYRNMQTDEVVYKEEAEDYVLNRLKMKIEPGVRNLEQEECISMLVDYYFSGNWIEEEIYDEEKADYEAEIEDMIYEDSVNKALGVY